MRAVVIEQFGKPKDVPKTAGRRGRLVIDTRGSGRRR